MAALDCIANSGTQALAADTAETILQLTAATNQRVKIKGYSVTMGGTVVKDLIVQVLSQSTAGTAGTTLTPVKLSTNAAETLQTTAKTGFTVEPTTSEVFQYKRLQSSYEKIFPLGQELIVPGGGRMAIKVESVGDTADLAAEFVYEE